MTGRGWGLGRAALSAAVTALFGLVAAAPPAHGATDPDFFGTYCGAQDFRECVRYRVCFFLGWPCVTRTRCETVAVRDVRVAVGHREASPGFGVVEGRGTARANGEAVTLNFAGVVTAPRRLRGSVASNLFRPHSGTATLSADGLALSVSARGHTLVLRKDGCGNRAPAVAFDEPTDHAVLDYGRSVRLAGRVTSDEDASFPIMRMELRSSRDGDLGSGLQVGSRGMALWTNRLSAGPHVLTFRAVDSGGLQGSASVAVTVVNRPPDAPTILHPVAGATLVATGLVRFEGRGYDPEDGILPDGSLVWAVSSGGGPFVTLGTGRRLDRAIAEPGAYTLRLTAVDGLGATASTTRAIAVAPYTGNTPPRVSIVQPAHLEWLGIAVLTGDELQLVATVDDAEDEPPDLALEWTSQATNPVGAPSVFGTATSAVTALSAIGTGTTEYTIRFTATDSGGLSGHTEFKIYVLSRPII
jgi:hypothetical protein